MESVKTVVVVGSGGREHALASVLARTADVVVTPGGPGIPGSVSTPPEELDADLFVIGPEAPLVDGLADRLRDQGKLVFGPGADGAALEGSKAWMKEVVADEATKRDQVMATVRTAFKPEFLNRLDEVVVFDALSRDELATIVGLQVQLLGDRLADRRITLEVSDAAAAWLAERGYDPAYGARPLRRLIQTEIGDRLARGVLDGTVRDGSAVRVGVTGGGDALTLG